eukprot:45155-Pyramimonas_sp.AAC.1
MARAAGAVESPPVSSSSLVWDGGVLFGFRRRWVQHRGQLTLPLTNCVNSRCSQPKYRPTAVGGSISMPFGQM